MSLGWEDFLDRIYYEEKSYKYGYIQGKTLVYQKMSLLKYEKTRYMMEEIFAHI